jgi:hypothetical protein
MKKNENKKAKKNVEIYSLKQFKELYFPERTKKEKQDKMPTSEYGTTVAASILEGIRRDLRGTSTK